MLAAVRCADLRNALQLLDVIRLQTREGFDLKSWQTVLSLCQSEGLEDEVERLRREMNDKKVAVRGGFSDEEI